jgi:hypothetical protein
MPEGINRQLCCHKLKSGASVLSHSIAQLSCNSLASSSLFFSLLFDNLSRIFFRFLFSLVPVAYRRKWFGFYSRVLRRSVKGPFALETADNLKWLPPL